MLSKKLLGAAAADEPLYIEDVFSTWLYTGNSPSTQSIVNGIDLAGKGGMVWVKSRVSGDGSTYNNILMDTARGTGSGNILYSNLTLAAQTAPNAGISSFNSNGFSLRYDDGYGTNYPSGGTFASWTFRKAEKFFDVVTWTGNNASERAISHNLGSVPGCIIVKAYTGSFANLINWIVYHRSAGTSSGYPQYLKLNSTDAATPSTTVWGSTAFTSTNFYIGADDEINNSNKTYVAYLFAHDAGGFGDDGNQNVISCGSYTGNGTTTGPTVNLGYEPQWILVKRASGGTGQWEIYDSMRGMTVGGNEAILRPNTSDAELNTVNRITPTATGFFASDSDGDVNANGSTYIYIAIRRGPMKTPEVGTEVFSPVAYTGGTTNRLLDYGFPVDAWFAFARTGTPLSSYEWPLFTRLLGTGNALETTNGGAWGGGWGPNYLRIDNNSGVLLTTSTAYFNSASSTYSAYGFRRSPGFFDVVDYQGSGSTKTVSHNLNVAPELMIVKWTALEYSSQDWAVYHSDLGPTKLLKLNTTGAATTTSSPWNNTAPTNSVFTVGTAVETNGIGSSVPRYIAYLFATVPGVSKVGSYTGTGTTQQINCGFSSGARFVLIKRTDSTGDWYVWDTARGIVAGNDPYLLLNSTAAEVTSTDYIDTYSAGFEISSTAPAAINANGGTFIFLAIA